MEEMNDFNKKRKRGLIILFINEVIAVSSLYYYKIGGWDWVFYTIVGYLVFSSLLLINRILKTKPRDETNYVFGKAVGEKMQKFPQKMIYEITMMSLLFLMLGGLASSIYSIIYSQISVVYKVIIGISGFFGALFLLMILFTTFQQYKQFQEAQNFMNMMALNNATQNIMLDVFKDDLKGGKE